MKATPLVHAARTGVVLAHAMSSGRAVVDEVPRNGDADARDVGQIAEERRVVTRCAGRRLERDHQRRVLRHRCCRGEGGHHCDGLHWHVIVQFASVALATVALFFA